MSKLILIDGNSIIHRAFYAMPPLQNSQGLHTNAVYGFANMLFKIIEEHKPTHLCVAFDAGKITFRHQSYKEYKGTRKKTPSELSEQFPLVKELLQACGIIHLEDTGYEADDIIGTFSKLGEEELEQVIIITGDKDLLQMSSDKTLVGLTKKGVTEMDYYTPEKIQEKYGLGPRQIIDLKGLMGDASDNIPGIEGVGEKTALKLLHQYQSVENVLAHVHELKGKLQERVMLNQEKAKLSKELATIYCEVPVPYGISELLFSGLDKLSLKALFERLEFKTLLSRVSFDEAPAEDIVREALDVKILQEADLQKIEWNDHSPEYVQFEIHGENPHRAELIGIGFKWESSYYYCEASLIMPYFKNWLEDSHIAKIGFNLHLAEDVLYWKDIQFKGATFDVLLSAYLLDAADGNVDFASICRKYDINFVSPDEEVYGKGAKFKIPEVEVIAQHVGRKIEALEILVPKMQNLLKENQMETLYYELELPLSKILGGMETQGISVDPKVLEGLKEEFSAQLEESTARIYELAGTTFNINSPKQLGEILFVRLGLPVIKKTKTGFSTDAEVLEKLAPYHEIVALLLHYRQISKLQSTYVEGLLKEISEKTKRVHTYFSQTITATGRLSSQYPNLQNIPIRLKEGQKIRKAFIASEEGWEILSADYSQIELRVLAHISQDPGLQEAFMHHIDVHTKTAMDVFKVQEHEVDALMRRQAKAVNFGIVYGISDYGLSQNLNITRKEAADFIEEYFRVFHGVKEYMNSIVAQAKKEGYVKTLIHRRRYLPEIHSSNYNLRSFGERTAMNTPIQGTAADIIKIAMVNMAEELRKKKLKSRMLLQVHDELVFEVPPDEIEIMKACVKEVMENAVQLCVPLEVEVSCGVNWYAAKG